MFFVAVVVVVVVVAVVLLLVLFMLVVGWWWWWWCRLQWLCRNAVVAVVGVWCCCIRRCFGGIHRTGEKTHYRTGTKPQPLNPISFAKKNECFHNRLLCAFLCFVSLRAKQDMQYQEQKRAMESGMPAFQIYVRTKLNNMW